MNICPNCGKQHAEGATLCVAREMPLVEDALSRPTGETPPVKPKPASDANLAYPEYQWKVRDAWKALGLIVLLWFVAGVLVELVLYRAFPVLSSGVCRSLIEASLTVAILLFPAVFFARTESWTSFLEAFGLNRRPSFYLPYGISVALALRFLGIVIVYLGIGNGRSGSVNRDLHQFSQSHGLTGLLYLLPLLVMAPLFEEIVSRGFLYPAFRRSYSIGLSMTLIVVWTALTHMDQFSKSFSAVVCLSLGNIFICYLREKSNSLWDCIISHFVFNASIFMSSNHT